MGNPTDWGNTPHYKSYQKGKGKSDNKGPSGKKAKPAKVFARARGVQASSADPMRGRWIWVLHAPSRLRDWYNDQLHRFNNPVPPLS